MRKSVGVLAGCVVLTAASFVVIDGADPLRAEASGLTAFDSCDAALGYLKDEAVERMGPYGLEYGGSGRGEFQVGGAEESTADLARPANGAEDSDAGAAHSTTNVQETGVDEPDVVKTDGEILVTAADDHVRIYDVTGAGAPVELSDLDLAHNVYGGTLLLSGDTLLVFTTTYRDGWRDDRIPLLGGDGSVTVVTQVDVSDPADPQVTGTLELDARMLDVRRADDRVTVVTAAQPKLEAPVEPDVFYRERGPDPREMRAQENINRQVVQQSTADDWLPQYRLEAGGESSSGALIDCADLHRPDVFPGFGTVTVLSFDLAGPLTADDTTAVLTSGDLVYATADTLYVTTHEFGDVVVPFGGAADIAIGPAGPMNADTAIHAFGLSDGQPTYLASGEVDGGVKDRFALSEHEGLLRVATTTMDDDGVTESQVVVLERQGNDLIEIGAVGGLGRTEQIYAVRYFGDTAYVVTFRQTDPLYVLDLSDPRDPKATGELKITGYSGYLHGVGDGRLIGVGQEATPEGRTIGAQVSLFDVSDPAAPGKLDGHVVEGAWTDAEIDPHAFLFWEQTGQLILPISGQKADESGALVLRVGVDSVDEQGLIPYAGPSSADDDEWWAPYAMRTVVVGDQLYTVWENGVQASSLDTLEPAGFAAF